MVVTWAEDDGYWRDIDIEAVQFVLGFTVKSRSSGQLVGISEQPRYCKTLIESINNQSLCSSITKHTKKKKKVSRVKKLNLYCRENILIIYLYEVNKTLLISN